jgi:transposase
LLPRGRRGAHRVDDRRVISGIPHMLRVGARWREGRGRRDVRYCVDALALQGLAD